jgi:hypothetical protein
MSAENEKSFVEEHLTEIVMVGSVASLLGAAGAIAIRRLRASRHEADQVLDAGTDSAD